MSTLKERRTWVKPVLNAKAIHNTQDYHQTCHLSGAAGQHKFLYRLLSLNNFGVSLHLEPCNFVTSKPVPNTSQCPELNLNALGVCKYRKLLFHHFECFRAKTATVARKAVWTAISDTVSWDITVGAVLACDQVWEVWLTTGISNFLPIFLSSFSLNFCPKWLLCLSNKNILWLFPKELFLWT